MATIEVESVPVVDVISTPEADREIKVTPAEPAEAIVEAAAALAIGEPTQAVTEPEAVEPTAAPAEDDKPAEEPEAETLPKEDTKVVEPETPAVGVEAVTAEPEPAIEGLPVTVDEEAAPAAVEETKGEAVAEETAAVSE